MKLTMVKSALVTSVLTIAPFLTQSTLALDYSVDLSLDSEYEDNATLTSDTRSDIQNTAGLLLNARQDTKRLQYSGNYSLRYLDFKNDSNDSRGELRGISNLLAEVSPRGLYWTLTHSLTEQTRNAREIDTADNQELRQEISTGPRIQYNITGRDTLTVDGRYSEIFYSTPSDNNPQSTADTTSQLGSVNWSHAFSRITNLTAGYSYRETTRDGTEALPERTNTFQNAYLGFNRQLRELRYGVQLGGSRSKPDNGLVSSGLYYSAELIRTSGDTTIGLSASQEQTDTSTGLDRSSDLYSAFDNIASLLDSELSLSNANIEGVVEVTAYQLNYRSSRYCARCSYSFRYDFIDNNYENNPDANDKQHSINVRYTLRLNSQLNTVLSSQWDKTEVEDSTTTITTGDIKENRTSLGLNWSASQKLRLSLAVGYEERSESQGNDAYDTFASIGLRYRLVESESN